MRNYHNKKINASEKGEQTAAHIMPPSEQVGCTYI